MRSEPAPRRVMNVAGTLELDSMLWRLRSQRVIIIIIIIIHKNRMRPAAAMLL